MDCVTVNHDDPFNVMVVESNDTIFNENRPRMRKSRETQQVNKEKTTPDTHPANQVEKMRKNEFLKSYKGFSTFVIIQFNL